MALKKSIEGINGYSAEYWRICALIRNLTGDSVVIEGYKDKASRDAKKKSLTRKMFKHSSFLNIVDAYIFLKTQSFFDNAEDV
jgi:hypothetical protein